MCIITTAMTTSILGALGATLASQATATAASIMAVGANALIGAGVVGAGIAGAVQQGKATQAQMNYQAQVERRNARIAQQNADQKRQEGIEESRLLRIKNLQKIGSQQAAIAANGVDVSEGTALDIIEDTAAMGELDALTTRYNYETQALSYEQQANNYYNQANLDVISGQNAYRAGVINAVGEGFKGLSSAASVADKWYTPNSSATLTTRAQRVSGGVRGDNILFA